MEAMLKQISKRDIPKETVNSRGYMPRVHEIEPHVSGLSTAITENALLLCGLMAFYCAKIRAPI